MLKRLTAQIVMAYIERHSIDVRDLASLIRDTSEALEAAVSPPPPNPQPAVPVDQSVTANHVICLECGKKTIVLTRHLRTVHGLTPAEYRQKWDLPRDYPMVARNYRKTRQRIAREIGLGRPGS